MNDLIADLRKLRDEKGISQESLAHHIGMNSQSGISALENGRRSPTLFTLMNWADALGYEIVLRPKQ